MRKIELVNIEGLKWDHLPINKQTLDLVFFLMSGGNVPAIKLEKIKHGYKIKDGRHRIAAYKLLGRKLIFAKFYEPVLNEEAH